jgi:micrococcal nuclease
MMNFYFILGGMALGGFAFAQENPAQSPCFHPPKAFRCVKYIKNYDGDTLTVDIPNLHSFFGRNAKVRVRGMDTPEIHGHQPCEREAARNARRLLESLLKNAKRIDLENVDKDKYFRILADVQVDDRSVAGLMIKNELAYPYDGGRKVLRNWCRKPKL